MKDEKDLEELGELVEVLKRIERGHCGDCPLYYEHRFIVVDECDSLVMSIFNESKTDVKTHCRKVLDKKIEEVTTYIFERSLKGE